MKDITGKMEYTKPNSASGCWEFDYEQEDSGEPIDSLTLMRSNRPDARGIKTMISSLEPFAFSESKQGVNDLRLIISAPKMYEALVVAWNQLNRGPDMNVDELRESVEDALLAAEQFVIPWEDEV